jgi:hypothetical protein
LAEKLTRDMLSERKRNRENILFTEGAFIMLMGTHGYSCAYLSSYGYNGYSWVFMGILWVLMGTNGNICELMGTMGINGY